MKLIRSQAEGVVQVLKDVLINNRYTDKSLERLFKDSSKLLSTDKAFIAETSYSIIRYYRMLEEVSRSRSLWKLLGAWAVLQNYALPDWKEFASITPDEVKRNHGKISTDRKIRESIPDWLDELGERELGSRWEVELKALNTTPGISLRVNRLKTSREELQRLLADEGFTTTAPDSFPEALLLTGDKNIFQSKAFQEGLFEIQDAGSQCIVPFLKVEPGMRVIDACAGTGGKSLQLAAHMKNKGRLIAMDVSAWKLDELKMRTRRAGVHNFETRLIDSAKITKRFHNAADRLLLDVPCSGLGVLKRNPDAKWKLKPDYISRLIDTQKEILERYSSMVNIDGLLVYSTCSVLPSENENQIHNFLTNHSSTFELEEEKTIHPSEGFDGFYMARLKRLA